MQMIEPPRLALRPLTMDDVDHLWGLFSDSAATSPGPMPEAHHNTEDWIRQNREHVDRHGFGLQAVVHKRSGVFIGYGGLCRQPNVAGRDEVEIICAVLPTHRERGYATEAARACRDEGFSRLGLKRLVALIHPANAAARRVAEKIGMHLEKEITRGDRQMCLYAVQRDDGLGRIPGAHHAAAAPCFATFRLTR